jgi:hypothetical protein
VATEIRLGSRACTQKAENLPTTGTMDSDTGAKLSVKVNTEGRQSTSKTRRTS